MAGDVPWADLAKQVFGYAGDEDLLVIDEQEREAWIAARCLDHAIVLVNIPEQSPNL